jgi:hypothetical protein
MATPKDILLSARLVIKQHGNSAEEYATKMMWRFKQKKDEKGAATWYSIIESIKELRNQFPPKALN